MASNTRDVTLRLLVKTLGEENVKNLQDALAQLGDEGQSTAAGLEKMAAELEQSKAATQRLRDAEKVLHDDLSTAKAAIQAKRDALRLSSIETDSATKRTSEYAAQVRTERLALFEAEKALRAKSSALVQAKTDAVIAANTERALAADLVKVAAAYSATGQAAGASGAQQSKANTQVAASIHELGAQLRTLQTLATTAVGGGLLGGLVGDVAKTADAYKDLGARIKLVTGEGAAFDQAFAGVFEVATRTNTAVADTGALFTRLAQAGKALGVGTADALRLTETINQAVQVSGSSAEASSAAITQLIQGLQSGVLRGDEFNSVMEQAPRLAKALADGIGVTTGELRKLAEAGSLTSSTVIGALQGQSAALQAEFTQLPATVGRAISNLSTAWTQYVGEADKATGASTTAAQAINLLAANLDTLGTLLYSAGKAAAAYQALKLAQTFLSVGTAAAVATKEVTALAAAQAAANGAASTSTAGMGRFAAALSSLKVGALLAVVVNLREIGTWLGEGVAKLQGYGKELENNERRMRANEAASQAMSDEVRRLAQANALAAREALGLTKSSALLVAEFDLVITKSGNTTEAVDKLAKSLQLGGLHGITDAGAALDALAIKGQVSAGQIRDAYTTALKDIDLQAFVTQARAAFDNTEQGARRLAAAIDGALAESVRRAGLDMSVLTTGMSEGARKALNDFDLLTAQVETLRQKGADTGLVLASSLNKATEAATSERALREVIDRWEQLGRQGTITGQQLAQGLEQARRKLDELKPGINSLDEAFKQLGMRGPTELNRVADASKAAWERIKNDGTVALTAKQDAFKRFADDAIAANGGVVSSEVRLQAEMLKLRVETDDTGRAIVRMAEGGGAALDGLGRKARQVTAEISKANQAAQIGQGVKDRQSHTNGSVTGDDNNALFGLQQKQADGTLSAADLATAKAAYDAAMVNLHIAQSQPGQFSLDGQRSAEAAAASARAILDALGGPGGGAGLGASGANSTAPGSLHTVKIELGGRATNINTASAQDASSLAGILRSLDSAAGTAAG